MKKCYKVLLADDSEDDLLFMRRAIQANSRFQIVGEVEDGQMAIEYLNGDNEFADRAQYSFPDILILDLKMPRKTGHEVLKWLQGQKFNHLFVAVVSGSFLPEDILLSKNLGATAYFRKVATKKELELIIDSLIALVEGVRSNQEIFPSLI